MSAKPRKQREFFYWDGPLAADKELHQSILDQGDEQAARAVSREVAKRLGLSDADVMAIRSGDWSEEDHPRDEDGKFTDAGGGDGGGGGGGGGAVAAAPSAEAKTAAPKAAAEPKVAAVEPPKAVELVVGDKPSATVLPMGPTPPNVTHSIVQALGKAKAGVDAGTAAAVSPALAGNQGHPGQISTANISATPKFAKGDSNRDYVRADLDQLRKDPALFARIVDLFRNTKNYPVRASEVSSKDPEKVIRNVIDHQKANLRWLYDTTPPVIRDRSALWYPGGRILIDEQVKAYGEKHGLTDVSAAGVYAAFSPRRDWDQNVYLGDRTIDIYFTKQNEPWDKDMIEKAETLTEVSLETSKEHGVANGIKVIQGKSLAELNDLKNAKGEPLSQPEIAKMKGLWIRVYDETHNPGKNFHVITPEGAHGDWSLKKSGEKAEATWAGLDSLQQAVECIEAKGDRTKISGILSDKKHKVRSFYNNLLDPFSANEDVTADTHAVGAAWLAPYGGDDAPVAHSLATGGGAKGSAKIGVFGSYAVYTEAIRELAHELGMAPRALQSITWVAKRERFNETMTDKQYEQVTKVWTDYQAGHVDLAGAQARIDKITPMRNPSWNK